MAGAAGTHLLRRRRSSPVAFRFCSGVAAAASPVAFRFCNATLALRSPCASALSSSRAAADDSFWSCCMVWPPPQLPLASLPAARVSRRGFGGYFSGASRGIWREICRAGSENHLRASDPRRRRRTGTDQTTGARTRRLALEHAPVRLVERDDGFARFLHLMSVGRVFLQKESTCRRMLANRCICP